MPLYTINGKRLQLFGNNVYSKSGKIIEKIKGEKVFAPNGNTLEH